MKIIFIGLFISLALLLWAFTGFKMPNLDLAYSQNAPVYDIYIYILSTMMVPYEPFFIAI
jgi:hypothetical protein